MQEARQKKNKATNISVFREFMSVNLLSCTTDLLMHSKQPLIIKGVLQQHSLVENFLPVMQIIWEAQ